MVYFCKLKSLLLILLLLLLLVGCKEEILQSLSEERANQVVVLLAEQGLSAKKQKNGTTWSISVADNDATKALKAIDAQRILKRDVSYIEQIGSGLMQSKEQRQYALERQLAWNIEKTIERIPGVLEARSHFYFEPTKGFSLEDKPELRKASVLIIVENDADIDTAIVQQLVSGASSVVSEEVSVAVVTQVVSREIAPAEVVAANVVPDEQSSKIKINSKNNILTTCGILLILIGFVFCRRKSIQKEGVRAKDIDQLNSVFVGKEHSLITNPSEQVV